MCRIKKKIGFFNIRSLAENGVLVLDFSFSLSLFSLPRRHQVQKNRRYLLWCTRTVSPFRSKVALTVLERGVCSFTSASLGRHHAR